MTHRWKVRWTVGVAALAMLACQEALVAQSTSGASPHREALADPAQVDGRAPPFVVLTRENRSVQETTNDAKNADQKNVSRTETHSKEQVALRVWTEIIHPTPQIRHATDAYQPIYLERTAAEDKLHAVLDQPLPEPWELSEAPLRDVRRMIMDQFRIPCEIDTRALEDAGLDLDTPVNASLERVSLRSALRRLLGNIDLAYFVKDDRLLLTTKERAEEHLVIGCYPLPTFFLVPERNDVIDLTDLIQSTVAAETWDTVGGPGAIRLLPVTNELVISQAEEVHEQLAKVMARFDADLGPAGANGAAVVLRFYPVRDPRAFADLEAKLVATCNAALGAAADPAARVSSLGGKLVVRSASRPFHIYAAEVVRSINGVEVVRQDLYPLQTGIHGGVGTAGGQIGGNPFCWVAREVYGEHDPRWIAFRAWLLNEAPVWLRETYGRHGEWFAAWLRRHPVAKAALRPLMDAAIAGGR